MIKQLIKFSGISNWTTKIFRIKIAARKSGYFFYSNMRVAIEVVVREVVAAAFEQKICSLIIYQTEL